MKNLLLASLFLGTLFTFGCGDDVPTDDAAVSDTVETKDAVVDGNATQDTIPDAIPDATPDAAPEGIEVAGIWTNSFSDVEEITNTAWAAATVTQYDNSDNFAITQNPSDATPPNTFNKIVWTEIEGDVFYYCTVDFELGTEEEAVNTTKTADGSDLAAGCGGFQWTMMTRQP